MSIDVQLATAATDLPGIERIEEIARRTLARCDRGGYEVCVRVVDAEESRALNSQYRGKDKPTNVLSFPAELALDGVRLLGDLAICAPVVACEAREQGKSLQDHYAHMLVHGLLHLCGYDHEAEADAAAMESLEVELLALFDIRDPYQ